MLSGDKLRMAVMEGQCKRSDGKFEYLQDGEVLTTTHCFQEMAVIVHLK